MTPTTYPPPKLLKPHLLEEDSSSYIPIIFPSTLPTSTCWTPQIIPLHRQSEMIHLNLMILLRKQTAKRLASLHQKMSMPTMPM
jgi:hypothetical protein